LRTCAFAKPNLIPLGGNRDAGAGAESFTGIYCFLYYFLSF
jgi:hypothetical protein